MEDEETLQPRTIISELPQFIHDGVNELLANSVVSAGVFGNMSWSITIHKLKKLTIVGRILLASDESLWMEERFIGARLDIVDDSRLKIYVERTWDVFSCASLGEEGREPAVGR